MKKLRMTVLLVTMVVVGSATTVAAANLQWLNYSPVRFFTDKDWEMAKAAARKALNETADGQAVEWTNPASGSSGSLTPLSTVKKDGATCRTLKIVNQVRNLEGSSVYEFCQRRNGTWGAVQDAPN